MTDYVLDTNIVSLILRRSPTVMMRFRTALKPQHRFIACPVVWYEIRRGLLAKDAKSQMHDFEALFTRFVWQDYTQSDWTLGSELWFQRRAQGKPIHDADLLIGVFTRNRGATLVTDNAKDFSGLNLSIENWV